MTPRFTSSNLQQFATDREAHFAKLEQLVQQPDNIALQALAHATKGVAGNLALMTLHQIYNKLESQAAGAEPVVIDLVVLNAAWDEFTQALQTLVTPTSTVQSEAKPNMPFDSAQFLALLDQLAQSATQAEIDDKLTNHAIASGRNATPNMDKANHPRL